MNEAKDGKRCNGLQWFVIPGRRLERPRHPGTAAPQCRWLRPSLAQPPRRRTVGIIPNCFVTHSSSRSLAETYGGLNCVLPVHENIRMTEKSSLYAMGQIRAL